MNDTSIQIGSMTSGADEVTIVAPETNRQTKRSRPNLKYTFELIRSDIAHRCIREKKEPTRARMLRMLQNPGICTVIRYRLQCFFMANRMGLIGRALKWYNLFVYSVLLDENARIGGGFVIAHPILIVVTGDVEIGERCVFFHQNSVCASQFYEPGVENGPVVIGNDVLFGGGSCAYGRIVVGDGCHIGANSVVDRSFPAGSVMFGVPARAIAKAKDPVQDHA